MTKSIIMYHICVFIYCINILTVFASNNAIHRFSVSQSEHLNKRTVDDLSSHRISKRSAVSDECQKRKQEFTADLVNNTKFCDVFKFTGEEKMSLALTWLGGNSGKLLAVFTEEIYVFKQPSTVYSSDDYGVSWTDISNKVKSDGSFVIRKDNGLQKSSADNAPLYLIGYGSGDFANSELYITQDGGASFDHRTLDFALESEMVFSEEDASHILTLSSSSNLHLSIDKGLNWKKILDNVVSFKWNTDKKAKNLIYASVLNGNQDIMGEPMSTLKRSEDLGITWTDIKFDIYSFGIQDKFIYVSRTQADNSRVMEVTTDGGANWQETLLPTVASDRFYSILDASEDFIFIHVDDPSDSGHGTLYSSDETGIYFTKSLENHLYPNGVIDLTDFYRVQSMRSVYLASVIDPADDNSINSVITYNRGGKWTPIARPDNAQCLDETKECNLHISGMFAKQQGVLNSLPLSSPSAPGILLVHGHVADSAQTTDPDVFISTDGGYTFSKALDGPHMYTIADKGELLVALPLTAKTNIVKFSTDEGSCWEEYTFTDTPLTITGLLTEPGSKTLNVNIWGYDDLSRNWTVVTLDFSEVIKKACGAEDYVEWTPHLKGTGAGCVLGIKEKFQKVKADSFCYNGYSKELPPTNEFCSCTSEDFECEYGYIREAITDKCVEDSIFQDKKLDVCIRGELQQFVFEGYRKIAGDKCKGGLEDNKDYKGAKMLDLHLQCQEGNKEDIFDELTDKEKKTNKEVEYAEKGYEMEKRKLAEGKPEDNGGEVAVILIVVGTLGVVLTITIILVHKYTKLRKSRLAYRYSQFDEVNANFGDEENFLTGPSLYEDVSDEEITRTSKGNAAYGSLSNGHMPASVVTPSNSGLVDHGEKLLDHSEPQVKVKSYHDFSDDDLLH